MLTLPWRVKDSDRWQGREVELRILNNAESVFFNVIYFEQQCQLKSPNISNVRAFLFYYISNEL